MRLILLFLAILGSVLAAPNGFYHQEYNYKSSSKSFKNNELQRSTDDQGYYRKDGDLEGRQKPLVDANSEHSEYVNPNTRNAPYTSGYGGANADMSSYGQLHSQGGYGGYGVNDLKAEGSSYGANSYGSNSYGSSQYGSSGSYGSSAAYTSSSLQSIVERLQREMEDDLRAQIHEHNAYSQARLDLNELESQVRRNVSERFLNELNSRYGQQTIRNGMSYSITGGKVQSTANYNEQDLASLRRELENTLLGQLRTGYNQRYYEENHQGAESHSYRYTTVRPTSYHSIYPSLPYYSTTPRPVYPINSNSRYSTINSNVINSNVRYTPIPNPETITTILTRVQSDQDRELNSLLDDVYRRYFSSSQSYQLANTDVVLQRLENELRSNLTYLIDEELRRNYGSQTERNGQMYSIGPNGEISNDYNYSVRDLENLRATVERHLTQKLSETFQSYKTRWYAQQSQSSNIISSSTYSPHTSTHYPTPRYGVYTTPRYEVYSTPIAHSTPRYYYSTPLSSSSHIKGGSNHYGYSSGSSYSGYEMSGGASSGSIAQVQNQVQSDISREMQAAINRYFNTYSSSSPQAYQASLQQLGDELSRNVTRHLQEYSGSASYSTSGSFSEGQVESLRNQLLNDMMRQLEQNLQQHFQTSSSYSYSASSGGSAHYRPTRNYQMGQYRSGGQVMIGEDCDHDDPSYHRMKRSYGTGYRTSYGRPKTTTSRPSQEVEDVDLTLQGQHQIDIGQEVDDLDLTQQVEDYGYGHHQQGQIPLEPPNEFGQQIDDSDDTQKIESSEFGHLTVGNQYPKQGQVEDLELGQQEIDDGQKIEEPDAELRQEVHGKLENQHQSSHFGQRTDNSDLTQQTQDTEYGTLDVGNHHSHSWQGNGKLDINQQVEDNVEPEVSNPKIFDETHRLKDQVTQDMWKNLQDEMKTYKALGSSPQSQVYFQEMSNELDRNITRKLTEIVSNAQRNGYIYNDKYTALLKEEIKKNLLKEIQQERQSYGSSWHSSNSRVSQTSHTQHHFTASHPTTYSGSNTEQSDDVFYRGLTKKQIRFAKYVKDKLEIDLRDAIKRERANQPNSQFETIYQQLNIDGQENITSVFNSYSKYFLNDYLELSDQQITQIKNQLTNELALQLKNEGQKYNSDTSNQKPQEKDGTEFSDEDENYQTAVEFHPKPRIPSDSLHQQTEPKHLSTDIYRHNEFVGQTVEDDNTQQVYKPVVSQPQNQYGNNLQVNQPLNQHGIRPQNEPLGQVIEDDTQQLENDFYPHPQAPTRPNHSLNQYGTRPAASYNQQVREQNQNEFQGQVIEDDDTQQLENEYNPHSQIPSDSLELQHNLQPNQPVNPPPQTQDNLVARPPYPKITSSNLLHNLQPNQPVISQPDQDNLQIRHPYPESTSSKPQFTIYAQNPFRTESSSGQNYYHQQVQGQHYIGQTVENDRNSLHSLPELPPLSNPPYHTASEISSGNLQSQSPLIGKPQVQNQYGNRPPVNQLTSQNSFVGQEQDNTDDDTQHPENDLYSSRIPSANVETEPKQNELHAFGQSIDDSRPDDHIGHPQSHFERNPQVAAINDDVHQANQQIEDSFLAQSQLPGHNPIKPIGTSAFIQTEIDQHHQNVNNLPTLNQVIDEQKVTPGRAVSNIQLGLRSTTPQPLSEQVQPEQQAGQWFGITGQGQVITQPQTKQEAENDADQLIEALRNSQNRGQTVSGYTQPNPYQNQGYLSNSYSNSYGSSSGYQHTGYSGGYSYTPYRSYVDQQYPNQASGYNSVPSTIKPSTIRSPSYTNQLNYGTQEKLDNTKRQDQHIEDTSNIRPLELNHADEVQNVEHQAKPNVYAGVKGRRVTSNPEKLTIGNDQLVEHSGVDMRNENTGGEETTPVIPPEELPWYKRWGKKVKQGAHNLKEKIIG